MLKSSPRPPKGARGALFLWPRTDYGIRARSGSSESRIPNPQSPIPNPRLTMLNITLPDGSRRVFDKHVSVMAVAPLTIQGLAKDTEVGKVEVRVGERSVGKEVDCKSEYRG